MKKTIAKTVIAACLATAMCAALAACTTQPEGEARRVELSVRMHGEFCIINCKNAMKEGRITKNSDGAYVTSKRESGHGHGLNIVRGLVDKYGGEMKITAENGTFGVEIMLQQREDGHE